MTRTVFGRVVRVCRAAIFVVGLAMMLALVFGVATTALGATGGNFILGRANVASTVSKLTASISGPALQLVNTGAGTALDLRVGPSTTAPADKTVAPMKVDSQARIANLNADQLDGMDSTAFQMSGSKAADSDNLDGKDATQFADSAHTHSGADIDTGTVAGARIDDAIARDSEVSNGFIQGRGTARHSAVAITPGNNIWFWQLGDPGLWLSYDCRSDIAANGFVGIKNVSGSETVNVFSDNGSTDPSYRQLAPNEFFSQGASAAGEHITFQVQGSYIATIEVFTVNRTSDNRCHVQAQTLITKP